MTKSDVAYAVIRVGGQQFKVSAGDTIVVDRVDAEEGKSVTYDTLAVRTDSGTFDGDAAKHAKVKAKVFWARRSRSSPTSPRARSRRRRVIAVG
jgi:ribosomal protein L21